MKILASAWTPEQWVTLLTALISALAAAVTGIIAALHSRTATQQNTKLIREVKLPSDGVTLGTVVERIDQVLHMLTNLHLEDHGQEPLSPSTSPQIISSIPQPSPVLPESKT